MLATKTAVRAKASMRVAANRSVLTRAAVPISPEIVNWLSGNAPTTVRVCNLAADFYILLYLRDVVAVRATGTDGFNPIGGDDCRIYDDIKVIDWVMKLEALFRSKVSWMDGFMFTYLCAATAGELRHGPRMLSPLTTDHKAALAQWNIMGASSSDENSRATTQHKFLQALKAENAADYLALAIAVFSDYAWSSSFGGKKWAAIAQTGADRLTGKLDEIVFIDRVFDLKHNGGPMFDKNSAVDQQYLPQILDAKLKITKDAGWLAWLNHASAEVRACVVDAGTFGLWQGPTTATGSQPLPKGKAPAYVPPPPPPNKSIDYDPPGLACPNGACHV